MIGIISAVSKNGVIGIEENNKNKLPFYYPEDLKNFKKITSNSIVIMGRKTFESIGKPLPNRDNIVISSQNLKLPGVSYFDSIKNALNESLKLNKNIWFIGGSSIYQEGMEYADEIHLTLTPDYITGNVCAKFPFINPLLFQIINVNDLTDKLKYIIYKKI